jgi:hypothetical protein
MIEDPAVLVPHDEEQRRPPGLFVGSQRLVHVPDELVSGRDVVIGVLIVAIVRSGSSL